MSNDDDLSNDWVEMWTTRKDDYVLIDTSSKSMGSVGLLIYNKAECESVIIEDDELAHRLTVKMQENGVPVVHSRDFTPEPSKLEVLTNVMFDADCTIEEVNQVLRKFRRLSNNAPEIDIEIKRYSAKDM